MEKFEVGEKVLIRLHNRLSNRNFATDVIKEITKAGNYKTEKHGIYSKNGYQRGGDEWRSNYLVKYDIEIVKKENNIIKKGIIVNKIKNEDFDAYNLKNLEKIEKAIWGENE